MTEEIKTETLETTETETEIPKSAVRNHPLFKEITAKQSEELKATQAALESLKASIAEEKEAQRVAKLEEAGNYEQLKAEQAAKIEALENAHTRQIAEMSLRAKLAGAMNEQNEVFVYGAIALWDGKDADAYLATLKEDERNAPIFNGPAAIGQRGSSPAVPAKGGGSISGSQLQAMRESSDPADRRAAIEYTEKYLREHGSLAGLHG